MNEQTPPSEQQPPSPRRRLQMLLAIPDSQRTEAQWEEINDLEISLAPGNRIDAPDPGSRQAGGQNQGGNPRPPGSSPKAKKPFRKARKKPPRSEPPTGTP